MEDIGENKKRSHLVVLYIGSGIATIRYPLHVPPTSDEIMEEQNFAKKRIESCRNTGGSELAATGRLNLLFLKKITLVVFSFYMLL